MKTDLIAIGVISIFIAFISLTRTNDNKRKERIHKIAVILSLLAYLYFVTDITLLCRQGTVAREVSFIPFESYRTAMTTGWYGSGQYACMAIIGNVFMFLPIGMIAAFFAKKKQFVLSAIIGLICSLSIELAQFFTMLGTFEVDDIINNTWGALIGCSIVLILFKKRKLVENIKLSLPAAAFILAVHIIRITAFIIDLSR